VRQSGQGGAAPRAPQVAVVLRRVEVVRTHLAMESPDQLRPADRLVPGARFERRKPCPVPLYRRLYRDVGGQVYWHDRLEWTDAELAAYLARPEITVYEAMVHKDSAGYFELGQRDDGSVEIVYFGLTAPFIGRGLGGVMLTHAVREAWSMKANRVWLHTCTLDNEYALPNYKARGFREFKTERLEVHIEGRDIVSEKLLSS
jgi:GNAT superfamily N-acetyltransferase